MKKITLFAMLLIGVVAGYAQSAVVGTYNGDINLTHITGQESSLEAQSVTISETEEGKFNVTFPSISILGQFESGEFTIEDITVTANADGSYALAKEQFEIAITSPMTIAYPYSTFSGTIFADGAAEIIIEAVQNPEMGAVTTAYFYAEAVKGELPFIGTHTGELNLTNIDGSEVAMGEKSVTITDADGKVNVLFPSFTLALGFDTGEFTIEDITVTANADGSYTLAKEQFDIAVTSPMVTSFPNSTLAGTVNVDGSLEMTVAAQQQPGMALTTAKFTTGSNGDDPGDDPSDDPSVFEWGTATWNTEDGVVYEGIEAFQEAGLTLTYPNPTGFALSFLNVLVVEYDLYIDNAETPVKASSSAQGNTNVVIDYAFSEGHSYKVVTTKALLTQANLATFTTDTLSTNEDSYSISFTINGPELQKTIDVEAWMSLAIIDQNYTPTVSKVDVSEITSALGIGDISEAVMHPLSPNGSYCDHMDVFDWWRDADGEFTNYGGGWNSVFGHNAYPAVYCIKTNAAADSVTYYFYDYWSLYDPDEEPGGGSVVTRAPETSYHSVIWDWTNEDGSITQYKRSYRMDEGADYQSRVMYIAGGKSVIVRATLHFVSIEEYEKIMSIEEAKTTTSEPVAYYSITGARHSALQPGLNIVRYADGTARKVWVK